MVLKYFASVSIHVKIISENLDKVDRIYTSSVSLLSKHYEPGGTIDYF